MLATTIVVNNRGTVTWAAPSDPGGTQDVPRGQILADDFRLPDTGQAFVTFNGIEWSGIYAPGSLSGQPSSSIADNFTIRIYDFKGGVPGTVLHTLNVGTNAVRVDTGVDLFGTFDLFEYSFATDPISLPVFGQFGQLTYFISIANDTAIDPDTVWDWGSKGEHAGNSKFQFGGSDLWAPTCGGCSTDSLDFALTFTPATDAVPAPEPGTLSLLGLGIAALTRQRLGRNV